MKRFFFLTIALAAAAISCTKSGLLESPQTYENPIEFEPYAGKAPVTKATEVLTADIKESGFHVVGFVEGTDNAIDKENPYLFRDVTFANEKWGYTNAAYWPEGKELTFVAYGLNAASSFTDETTDYTSLAFAVKDKVAEQKDLVISKAVTDKGAGVVTVQLHHVLSRIGFKVETTGSDDVKATIKNITISGDFVTSGTFDLVNAVKGGESATEYDHTPNAAQAISYSLFDSDYAAKSETNKDYPCFVAEGEDEFPIYSNATFNPSTNPYDDFTDPTATADATKEANRFMMLMPQTVNATIQVIYQLTDGIEQTANLVLNNQVFAPGKAYEIKFTISTVAVGFTVGVDNWAPATDTPVESPLTPAN